MIETKPMPLDAISSANHGLSDFRVSSVREIALILKQLCDGSVQLSINSSDGCVFTSAIWTVDAVRSTIGFNADLADLAMHALLQCEEVVAVGYLDNVKLQFDVHDPVLVRGSRAAVLCCPFPREVFRFQRRNAHRVRPPLRVSPQARLRADAHMDRAELELRVLDVSIGGCALFMPEDGPTLAPGLVLNAVQIELDADTRFEVNMRLAHVSTLSSDARGVRLGFEFVHAGGEALRALQRFINHTQRRGKLMALV